MDELRTKMELLEKEHEQLLDSYNALQADRQILKGKLSALAEEQKSILERLEELESRI